MKLGEAFNLEGIISTLFIMVIVGFWNVIRMAVFRIFYEIIILSIWQAFKWWGELWIKGVRFVSPQSLRTAIYYPIITKTLGCLLAIAINPISISMIVYHWPYIRPLIAG